MRRLLFLSCCLASTALADSLPVAIYGNHALSDDAILKMSGMGHDANLPPSEIRQRLETSGLFSSVSVRPTPARLLITVREKTNWFILPYFSSSSDSSVYGLAAGKSSLLGEHASVVGRFQVGTQNREASFLMRDEFFLDSFWSLGASVDYENALHRIYEGREVAARTDNRYHGGSIQIGYHFDVYLALGLNTYIERRHFQDADKFIYDGVQVSHRLFMDWGKLFLNEGLAKGMALRTYVELTNPMGDFDFEKMGTSVRWSVYREGDFNWIASPRYELGHNLPYYQRFELGGAKLRSFAIQQFRDSKYLAVQNDVLVTSIRAWSLIFRPLVYADWAWIQNAGRTALGAGFQVFFKDVSVPAVQFFGGYGWNPGGFSISAAIGPQI